MATGIDILNTKFDDDARQRLGPFKIKLSC